MTWLFPGCENCGEATAEVSCDACGEKLCCDCANILNCAIADTEGNLITHLCDDCAAQMEKDATAYEGLRLIVGGKKDV